MAEKERNLDADWLAFQAISAQAIYMCFAPILIYGIAKWIIFKRHMVIVKRFPMLSVAMVTLGFLNSTWWVIQAWMRTASTINYTPYTYNVTHVRSSLALSFANTGLINLRLFLTYLRWKYTKSVSAHTQNISLRPVDSNTETIASNTETIESNTIEMSSLDKQTPQRKVIHKLYTHWFSITIILLTSFGFFCNCFIMKAFIVWSTWTFVMIITIILIIIFAVNKVKDGIGSTKEGLVQVLMFIVAGLMNVTHDLGGVFPYIGHIVHSFLVYLQALYPLYIALYYIYKEEGTLNKKELKDETDQDAGVKIVDNNVANLTLFAFLEKNVENYTAFREFLGYMWALENLLFYERVCIFYEIVLKYRNSNVLGDVKIEKIKSIEFRYLKGIYQEYKNQIENICKDDNDIDNLKIAFFKICQQISSEFIENDGINCINISYDNRQQLLYLLQNEENMEKFTLDDFLSVFDDAKFEIQRLLRSVYKGRFISEYNRVNGNDD